LVSSSTHVTVLVLNRLDRREGAALVHQVVGTEVLPGDVVAEIVEHTDGVPLFVGRAGHRRIGKSRLTAALHERIGNEPHTRMRCRGAEQKPHERARTEQSESTGRTLFGQRAKGQWRSCQGTLTKPSIGSH
jgi:hypothetical protein